MTICSYNMTVESVCQEKRFSKRKKVRMIQCILRHGDLAQLIIKGQLKEREL